jgi:hypothetical protein
MRLKGNESVHSLREPSGGEAKAAIAGRVGRVVRRGAPVLGRSPARRASSSDVAYSAGLRRGRPVVDPRERVAHQAGAVAVRETVANPERLDALLIGQQRDGPGPICAPEAAIQPERVEDAPERIPDVPIRERIMRQGASSGDLDRDVGVGSQCQHLWQVGERLHGRRWLERLLEPEVVDHQLRVGIARGQLADLI